MTIHELEKLTHVKAETIRSYRKQGLLHPQINPKNGYYDYSPYQIQELLFIRKLRGIGLSLDTIDYTFTHNNLSGIIEKDKNELARLDEQIEQLQNQRRTLAMAIPMLESFQNNIQGPSIEEFTQGRIDGYDFDSWEDPVLMSWMEHIELFTQTLWISGSFFTSPELPAQIPVKVGFGTFTPLFNEYHLPVPEQAVHCPAGRYATGEVVLRDLEYIDRDQLEPMRELLRRQSIRKVSDTTGFLFRIEQDGNAQKFTFRIRARVED